MTRSAAEWTARGGFLVSGLFCSLPAVLLPAWGFDASNDYAAAGRYFLPLALGLIGSGIALHRISKALGISNALRVSKALRVLNALRARNLLLIATVTGALALGALAYSPVSSPEAKASLAALGAAAGFLHAGLFEALWSSWQRSPALTINSAGIFFGSGSILASLLAAAAFFAWPTDRLLLAMAIIPVAYLALIGRQSFPSLVIREETSVHQQFRSVLAILFALLLFFQFANEWSIASWIPLFLIHRFSMSPTTALYLLAIYFASILLGRALAYFFISRANHWRVLAVSGSLSVFASVVLSVTDSRFGAVVSILLLGVGFAPIYPVLAAWIGRNFPDYHPGFFNGIFSFGLAGGLLSPWLLGELASRTGIWVVTTLPALGTCMVMLLLGSIWLRAKMTGE